MVKVSDIQKNKNQKRKERKKKKTIKSGPSDPSLKFLEECDGTTFNQRLNE